MKMALGRKILSLTENGFSLPEITVSLGVLGLLAVAGMSVGVLLGQSTQYSEDMQSVMRVTSTIRERMKYGDLCTESIGTPSILNQGNIERNVLRQGNQQVEIRVPAIGAGAMGNEDVLRTGQIIPSANLSIEDLRFVNAENVSGDTYVALIQARFKTLRGRELRPVNLGLIQFNLSGPNTASNIVDCVGPDSSIPMNICTSMNCAWQDTPTPGCHCETISSLCPTGEYPVQFLPTGPVCQRLGNTCPAGQYLVSVGIGTNTCAPIPTPTPFPCPVQYINNCRADDKASGYTAGVCVAGYTGSCSYTCNNGVWTTPSSNTCALSCPIGTSTTGLGAAANPASCYCLNVGETWNGFVCMVPPPPPPPPLNGICGPANGGTFVDSASVNGAGLCFAGTPMPAVAGLGPWNWSCNGLNGGTNMACSASPAVMPTPTPAPTPAPTPISAWRVISAVNAPAARMNHLAVWTGSKMFIWGGNTIFATLGPLNDGAMYDPATNSWNAISSVNAPPHIDGGVCGGTAIWTGSKVIVWGPTSTTGPSAGGIYDPATDSWTTMSTVNAPKNTTCGAFAWTGTKLFSWAGRVSGNTFTYGGTSRIGSVYDPATNTWAPIASAGAPPQANVYDISGPAAIALSPTRVMVWGGSWWDGAAASWKTTGLDQPWIYDISTDTWTSISSSGNPQGRAWHALYPVGSRVLMMGADTPAVQDSGGSIYDPIGNTWAPTPSIPSTMFTFAGGMYISKTSAWTGSKLISWYGTLGSSNRGHSVYNVATNQWYNMSTLNEPNTRDGHSVIWTGSEMIIWGGYGKSAPTGMQNTGAAYNPALDSGVP